MLDAADEIVKIAADAAVLKKRRRLRSRAVSPIPPAVTLLQRTTRKLSLTAPGRAYFNQCSELLSHLFDAERVLTQTQKRPEGLLRISAPVILGQETFYAFLSSFLKTYPRIQADLFITNLFLDLIAENIDIAIRFGELQDLSLIAQRIGKSVRYVVAAPEYLHGGFPHRDPRTYASINASSCTRVTTRRNGIWSAARNPSSFTSRDRWRREISRRSALSPIGATASACYHRPIAMLRSRVENSSGFFLIGRRRKSSCMPSIRHADFCQRSCKYSSRT